jgi:hypothetical protein
MKPAFRFRKYAGRLATLVPVIRFITASWTYSRFQAARPSRPRVHLKALGYNNARRFGGQMVFVPEGQRDSSQARGASAVWTFAGDQVSENLPQRRGLRTQPRVSTRSSTLSFIHNSPVDRSSSRPHSLTRGHHRCTRAPLNGTSEHRLEAYATLTPWRRHSRCTAIATGMALGGGSTVQKANVA